MSKKLFIILITFNNEKVVEACLDSVAKQTFFNYKLLIIDNKSKDNTVKTIQEYLKKNQVLAQKTELLRNYQNVGFAKAVKLGLKKTLKKKNSEKGLVAVQSKFNWDEITQRTLQIYNQFLDIDDKNERKLYIKRKLF